MATKTGAPSSAAARTTQRRAASIGAAVRRHEAEGERRRRSPASATRPPDHRSERLPGEPQRHQRRAPTGMIVSATHSGMPIGRTFGPARGSRRTTPRRAVGQDRRRRRPRPRRPNSARDATRAPLAEELGGGERQVLALARRDAGRRRTRARA
ncbi:MAG: hypothetical protein MZV65_01120 [Chromatiales bacterium]|nr:hypothetical protein [Chromatiales bacterium]